MRKRILFRKTICSLLALLLSLSSLLVLPVLAADEEADAGDSVSAPSEPVSAPTESAPPEEPASGAETSNSTDTTAPIEEAEPAAVPETPKTDEPTEEPTEEAETTGTVDTAGETEPTETTEPEDEAAAPEATEPTGETGAVETTDSTDETGSEKDGDSDVNAAPEAEAGEQPDGAAGPEEEVQPAGGQKPEEEELLAKEDLLEKEKRLPPDFLDVALEPVSVENGSLVLRTSAAYYLGAQLIFSNDPTQQFTLEVKDVDNYRFCRDWEEIHDSRISVEITPPMDDFIVTLRLPLDFLKDYGISLTRADGITFNNQRYSLSDLDLPEKEIIPEELPPYEGITIDGNFDDWAGVAKTDMRNPNAAWPCTIQSAVVWDGDYVYIYFHVNDGNASAIGAMGTHSNGQFAITTDLGNIRLVQPDFGNNSVNIYGIDDALVAVDNYNWDPENGHSTEIAIPTSRLPVYKNSISFGFYQVEPFFQNIVNLNPVQGEIEVPTDFACDGTFGEWTYYPHTLIEYDTSGQQDSKVDGGAALHVVDGILYGHVKTAHIDHLAENGSEFLADIAIAFNGDLAYKDLPEKGNFYPKLVTEDGSTVVNEGTNNPQGITTYLISDIRDTTAEPGPYFGTMKISLDGTVDEMEFAIDLAKVAEYIGCDASDFKTIHARFGRIGDEWVQTAGTPTGPVLGLALCFATVGGAYAADRKKKKK